MTLEETAKIMKTIAAAWPQFLNGRDPEMTTKLWQRVFEHDTYDSVAQALFAYFSTDTSGFAPMPGKLREYIAKFAMSTAQELDPMQAWSLVHAACQGDGLYKSQEAFAALPKEVRDVVRDPEMLRTWALMDEEQVQTVVASNFMRTYKARQAHREEYFTLPEKLRPCLPQMASAPLPEVRKPALPEPETGEEAPEWFAQKALEAADVWTHDTEEWLRRRLEVTA